MTEAYSESWKTFIEQYPQLIRLQRRLAREEWFINDGWAMFIGPYHEGIFLQLYKAHWYNHTLDGIHIESGISPQSISERLLHIELHIGHRNLFDRERFNELSIPQMSKVVSSWGKGYDFSTTNLSARLSTDVSFTKGNFDERMAKELTRWSALGPIIDASLHKISA